MCLFGTRARCATNTTDNNATKLINAEWIQKLCHLTSPFTVELPNQVLNARAFRTSKRTDAIDFAKSSHALPHIHMQWPNDLNPNKMYRLKINKIAKNARLIHHLCGNNIVTGHWVFVYPT